MAARGLGVKGLDDLLPLYVSFADLTGGEAFGTNPSSNGIHNIVFIHAKAELATASRLYPPSSTKTSFPPDPEFAIVSRTCVITE
ncbi:hypothetical protein BB560_001442 [Smittium megazygosporum]|uniref:Uncharacterized protein n=1 Tax=Smittium megazygosporum TaxID=133381 RepID=A0A2T9ZHJ6_9FUNG|nr:hypothetical protein BB560_001442 [Smittium megazygosporum]